MKENKRLEFKEKVSNTFLKTVSAFANYDGGIIIFGIKDDGSFSPIDNLNQTCLDIENTINDNITPEVEYSLNINEIDKTIFLEVKSGHFKPYLYKSKAYKRNDTSTIEVDSLEFSRLVLEGKNINFESLPSDNQKLTFSFLKNKFKQILNIQSFNTDVLKTLSLYSDNNGFNKAAQLLSDENNFCGIDIAKFGDNINIIQYRKTLETSSILKLYEDSIEIFKNNYEYEEIKGSSRVQIQNIPETAFREALANAIIHRHWDINAKIRILMFNDKVEIISPGGLPSGLTKEEYLKGRISILRNPILSNVFYRLKIVEIFGTGVLRILDCYKESIRKPDFDISDNTITIILPFVVKDLGFSEDTRTVYNALSKTIEKPISEIIKTVPFGKSKIGEILNNLVESGYVSIIGNGRGTKYKIR